MNIALALEYIPRRMNDLGVGTNYFLRFKHLVLQPLEVREIAAGSQLFIMVDGNSNVRVVSDFALYDLADTSTNEQDYEHQGTILITNQADRVTHLRFIQVIPKN